MSATALRELRRGIALVVLFVLLLSAMQATADAKPSSAQTQTRGALTQLRGSRGCIGAPSARPAGCATARALKGPGPFMGSRAIAISPEGNNLYVASSTSNAIAIFDRDKQTGTLSQPSGKAGCIAIQGGAGCARAVGLIQPNSIVISGNGRNLYATSRAGNSVTAFARNRKTGALH